jgi:hypothetical protein
MLDWETFSAQLNSMAGISGNILMGRGVAKCLYGWEWYSAIWGIRRRRCANGGICGCSILRI